MDADEARRCGREAVKYCAEASSAAPWRCKRTAGKKYGIELFRTELKNVAEKTKSLPDEFINADGNGVTQAFMDYAMPLVGQLPQTEYLGDYPKV